MGLFSTINILGFLSTWYLIKNETVIACLFGVAMLWCFAFQFINWKFDCGWKIGEMVLHNNKIVEILCIDGSMCWCREVCNDNKPLHWQLKLSELEKLNLYE